MNDNSKHVDYSNPNKITLINNYMPFYIDLAQLSDA